jgi:uncharacterized protein (TIGR02391 family)
MAQLKDFLPPPETILDLEAEEVAVFLLEYLCNEQQPAGRPLNRTGFNGIVLYNLVSGNQIAQYAPQHDSDEVGKAITEAWSWLETEGMLAPHPGHSTGHVAYVTKKGFKHRRRIDLEIYLKAKLLPKQSLDKSILDNVYPLFLRGQYDTAVFQAFKEVEVRVRNKTELSNDSIGVKLMAAAFRAGSGILTNLDVPEAEQQALCQIFTGSIGIFKNPSSHREIDYNNPNEAAEIILFANYLIRLVDKCTVNARGAQAVPIESEK